MTSPVKSLVLFGAGASFGADNSPGAPTGPPLGKDLFAALVNDACPTWRSVPESFIPMFEKGFEYGMKALLEDPEQMAFQLRRDLELAVYFARFRPRFDTSLYGRFAAAVAAARKQSWSGALATLNYERLLEECLLAHRVFAHVAGVDFYDDQIPPLQPHEIVELCYPHGACHFFLGSNPFDLSAGGNVVLEGEFHGGGVNQLLVPGHVKIAAASYHLPLISRYEPAKSPSIKHKFFQTQRDRFAQLTVNAEQITIVGVFCAHEADSHLWRPLAESSAALHYFEPYDYPQQVFRSWAQAQGKREGRDFYVISGCFSDVFAEVLSASGLG